jgi:hypothetical protein
LPVLSRRKRKLLSGILGIILASFLFGLGCGGGSPGQQTTQQQNVTPAGKSSVVVTAAAGSQSASVTLTVIVE